MREAIPVFINEKEKNLWREILIKYYKERGDIDKTEIPSLIEQRIKASEDGWPHAPRSFRDRIMRKTGYGLSAATMEKAHKGITAKAIKCKEDKKHQNILKNIQNFDLDEVLSSKEQIWWHERLQIYLEDFEFNRSSDYILLQQLIVEELTQRRLAIKQISEPDNTSYSRLISESLKRLHDLQTKLGITREQRADEMDTKDGNVAVLSMSLDEKLKEINKIQDKEEREEKYYMALHNQRPLVNVLPPQEKIEAILGIKEDGAVEILNKNIDIANKVEKLHYNTMKENEPKISEHTKEDQSQAE